MTINIPQNSENSNRQDRDSINSELFSDLSKETPLLETTLDIHIPIEGGYKKESLSSCGFGVLRNRLKNINIDMTEKEIQETFLSTTPNCLRGIKKGYRNIFGTDPGAIQKGLNILLRGKSQPFICKKRSGLSFQEIIDILHTGQPIMVQYTRQQDYLFQTLKKKSKMFDTYFGDKSKHFTYGYPHYGLLVGIDGKDKTVEILDPDTGNIEKLPFTLWRSQFCLERPHQGILFHGARKLGIMKPQMGIYLQKNS